MLHRIYQGKKGKRYHFRVRILNKGKFFNKFRSFSNLEEGETWAENTKKEINASVSVPTILDRIRALEEEVSLIKEQMQIIIDLIKIKK